MKEATLILNSRFDCVWLQGESVLPGRAGVSLMWWPFSYRKKWFIGHTCYTRNLLNEPHCRNEEGLSVYDLLVEACILHRCHYICRGSGGDGIDADGDGGDGDGD